MSGAAHVKVVSGVATITLDQPDRRNSFGLDLRSALMSGIGDAIVDDSVRVIVLTNTGNTFSAGADVREERPHRWPARLPFHDLLDMVDASPKPIVGRIAGHAAGAGAGLAALCDVSVMLDSARFGITEVRLGAPPADIAAYLVHRVSYRALVEAVLTGEMMPAARAAELGLITLAVPQSDLDTAVQTYVDAFIQAAPKALAASKRYLQAMVGMTSDQARVLASDATAQLLLGSEELTEGVAAFLEKRRPSWVPAD